MTLKIFNGDEVATAGVDPRERATRVKRLLDEYSNAVKSAHREKMCLNVKPKDFEPGRAILAADSGDQIVIANMAARSLVQDLHLDSQRDFAFRELLKCLFRRELPYGPDETRTLFRTLEMDAMTVPTLPVGLIISSIGKHVARCGMSPVLRTGLERLATTLHPNAAYSEDRQLGVKIAALLKIRSADESESVAFDLDTGEAWANAALIELGQLANDVRTLWQRLFEHCCTAKQAKPSKKWLKAAGTLIDALGTDQFCRVLLPALAAVGQPGKCQLHNHGGFRSAGHPTAIHDKFADLLRGLVWATSCVDDPILVSRVGDAAEKCFQKIPEIGPRSPKVGNACLVALSSMHDVRAVAQLGRLKSRARHASTRKQIEKALERAAKQAGLSRADLEEIAVPTFGFTDVGRSEDPVGDYVATIAVDTRSKVSLQWIKADGKTQISVPAVIKADHAATLKELRHRVKEIGILMPSIGYRAEQLFLAERSWSLAEFRERWLDHPVVGVVARRLIWNLSTSNHESASAIWCDGELVNVHNEAVDVTREPPRVSIWHPMHATPREVLDWRNWLEANQVSQPFKQAHREVYLLTDAERETRVYSNRFAAHILRQHQLAALCQQRRWRYRLQGDWDSSNAPSIELPQFGLRAEFLVDPLDGLNEVSQSFVYTYLSTDQIRFHKSDSYEPLPLTDVPPLVFSEIMRDVDLFVGVTSVGNDPAWGEPSRGDTYHEYWQQYSFGDLSQTAQTRRSVLQNVIPKLKIAAQCKFDDRFLIVEGQLRTYKIHLGSGNVLMAPNDQYLCIVKKRDAGTKQTDSLYLPFDGDSTLSLILSKAFLLAADHQISEPTIKHQICTPSSVLC